MSFGKRKKIVFLYHRLTIQDVIYYRVIDAAGAALKIHGMDLILQPITSGSLSADTIGIIRLNGPLSDEELNLIGTIPYVNCMGIFNAPGDSVTYNNKTIGILAAEYILSRSFKRVGILSCSGGIFEGRTEALTTRLAGTGVEMIPTPVRNHEELYEHPENMRSIMEHYSKEHEMPEVFFSPADLLTAVLYSALKQQGFLPGKSPEIISCNYDQYITRQLESYMPHEIDLQAETIGWLAAEMLIHRLQNPQIPVQHIQVEPAFIPAVKPIK